MKKLFFALLVLALGSTITAQARIITIYKFAKGPSGYYTVHESHNGDSHSLSCTDPGNEACAWSTKPLIVTSVKSYDLDAVTENVETQIANGTMTGSYTLDNEISVSWTATSPTDYNLTLSDIN